MDDEIDRAAKLAREKHPKRNATPIQYGTAGFRAKSSLLDFVLYRMGMLAVLRSKHKAGATIGLIVTASHNPEEDNGVKLIDPMGEMLERSWELYANQLISASDNDLSSVLRSVVDQMSIKTEVEVKVVIARDTRPSSVGLSLAAQDGVQVLGGLTVDYGLMITPQLHYIVRCVNTKGAYGDPTEVGYYTKLATAFLKLRGGESSHGNYQPAVRVDGANGVGAPKLRSLIPYLNGMVDIRISNDGSSGKLNHNCGADFVKVQQKAPEGMRIEPNERCVSFDGDGDRIVFYYQNQSGTFFLVDGDKIATLMAGYLKELVSQSALELKFGLVQTAYANGSSTDYINNKLNVHVACVPTGVKYLHHEAMNFDIGVYFEANGHGTVLFSEAATSKIQTAAANQNQSPEQKMAAARLQTVIDLINQTTGDAISDLLLVETILHARGWSIADWNSTYTELPNRQVKVKVADRNVIQTTDAERKVTTPSGLQDSIDAIVSKYPKGRSFVRPSGTEDVVRVYSEAETQTAADELAYEVSVAVFKNAGGVGDPPQHVAL